MKIKIKQLFFLISFVVVALFTSCVNDDLSDCPTGRYLHFEIISNKNYKFKDIVETVDLYIYDGEKLLEIKPYTKSDLQSVDYKIYLDEQQTGTQLHYIALVNQKEGYYQTLNSEQRGDMLTEVIAAEGDSVKQKLPDLFHGAKDITFDYRLPNVSDTIYLKKNTNNINLFVAFTGYELPKNSRLNSFIQGSNGKYDSKNDPIETTNYTYVPYNWNLGNGEYAYDSQFTTMRLWFGAGTDIILEKEDFPDSPLRGSVQTLQKLNIPEELAKILGPDGKPLYEDDGMLQRDDEFDITMVLNGDFMIVELVINDWFVIRNGVPL